MPFWNRFAVPLTWPLRGHPLPVGARGFCRSNGTAKPFSPPGRRWRAAPD